MLNRWFPLVKDMVNLGYNIIIEWFLGDVDFAFIVVGTFGTIRLISRPFSSYIGCFTLPMHLLL